MATAQGALDFVGTAPSEAVGGVLACDISVGIQASQRSISVCGYVGICEYRRLGLMRWILWLCGIKDGRLTALCGEVSRNSVIVGLSGCRANEMHGKAVRDADIILCRLLQREGKHDTRAAHCNPRIKVK